MSEPSQKISLNSREALNLFEKADTNRNGWLLDPEDRWLHVSSKQGEGFVLASSQIQSQYLVLKQCIASSETQGKSCPSLKLNPFDMIQTDQAKREISSSDILALMRRNGGHLLRLADLASVYPNAKLRGEGQTLKKLAAHWIQSKKYPQGKSLGDALIDPGGELIVSHFFEKELRETAPSFTQFMTNKRGKNPDPDCHDPKKAFFKQSCHPDSWSVDLDTLLSQASLEISENSSSELVKALFTDRGPQNLAGIKRSKTSLEINLRDTEKVRVILKKLHDWFPSLSCDPDNKEHVVFHLGSQVIFFRLSSEQRLRRMLVALLNEPQAAVTYHHKDANNPAHFNRVAQKPSVHFLARMSPKNLNQVIFAILHIDAQSYKPAGKVFGKNFVGPNDFKGAYQHQGEVEPVYLRYHRDPKKSSWHLTKIYLGDHFIAEPVKSSSYRKELAVAYGSGGRILLPKETKKIPGAMFRNGIRSTNAAFPMTLSTLFRYYEVYPGRSETKTPYPTAATFSPKEYSMIIEGTDGDFLTTGRLLIANGKGGSTSLNEAGYPFVRGNGTTRGKNDRDRTEVSLTPYLERQDFLWNNFLMGGVSTLALKTSLFRSFASRSTSASFADSSGSISLWHEVTGTAWFNDYFYLDGYVYAPIAPMWKHIPQMGLQVYLPPQGAPRLDFSLDLISVRTGFGSLKHGITMMFEVMAGPHLYGVLDSAHHFGGGFQARGAVSLVYQQRWAEMRLGSEFRFEANLTNEGEGRVNAWSFLPLVLTLGGRVRRAE